jgi:hypothetical protein
LVEIGSIIKHVTDLVTLPTFQFPIGWLKLKLRNIKSTIQKRVLLTYYCLHIFFLYCFLFSPFTFSFLRRLERFYLGALGNGFDTTGSTRGAGLTTLGTRASGTGFGALGFGSRAVGTRFGALGFGTKAIGTGFSALGLGTRAVGKGLGALGGTWALGTGLSALGFGTRAVGKGFGAQA